MTFRVETPYLFASLSTDILKFSSDNHLFCSIMRARQDISKRPQGEERLDADRHLQRQRPPHDRRTATITHTTSTRIRTRHHQSGTR